MGGPSRPSGATWRQSKSVCQQDLAAGCRGCAGDSARPATHGRANRGAGRTPDRKRHETPDGRANTGARSPARHGASAGIRVPMCIPIIITTVIVGEPANMLVMLVGGVPIGVVVSDRRGFPVGIHLMRPPAIAVLIAGDIASFRLGAGYRGRHRNCARNSEKRTQSKRGVEPSHVSPFFAAIRQLFAAVISAARRRWFRL
jgi:hypothetical protein